MFIVSIIAIKVNTKRHIPYSRKINTLKFSNILKNSCKSRAYVLKYIIVNNFLYFGGKNEKRST